MAEVQDDEQWLYGDDKENENRNKDAEDKDGEKDKENLTTDKNDKKEENNSKEKDGETAKDTENGEGEKRDGEESSSDDDGPTVTIGKLVKQPDIIRPPAPTHRAAPTAGLKEDDFSSIGKINGIPLTEFNLNELEDRPWRKPGADLSDYFNYGFNEDTWNMYCDRQRKIRVSDSGVGMGIIGSSNMGKPMHSGPPSSGMNTTKYGTLRGNYNRRDDQVLHETLDDPSKGNTIQVMTAERRIYSSKAHQPNAMDSYGNNSAGAYGDPYYHGMGPPQNNMFSGPPPNYPPPPPADSHPMNVPPPGYVPNEPPPSGGQVVSLPGFDPVRIKEEGEDQRWSRSPESRARRESRDGKRRKRSRSGSYSKRRRSRSRSRHRSHSRPRRSHSRSRRSRTKSRSKSPSHRHRRKRSKRDREED